MGIVVTNCIHTHTQVSISILSFFRQYIMKDNKKEQRGNYCVLHAQLILMRMLKPVHSATGRAIGRSSDIYWTMGPNNRSENGNIAI